MSVLWLHLLGGVNAAVALYSLVSGLRHFAYVRRYLTRRPTPRNYVPSVTLLAPRCGNKDGLEENLRALFRQDYPDLDLVFIVESDSDSALAVIHRLLESEPRAARVVQLVELFDFIDRDESGLVRYHYVLVDYLCRHLDGELLAGSDVVAARLVPLDALSEYKVAPKGVEVIREAWNIAQAGG